MRRKQETDDAETANKERLQEEEQLDDKAEQSWLPKGNHMDEIVGFMLARLSGDLEVEFVKAMKRLESMLDGDCLHFAAGCAGTEIQSLNRESPARRARRDRS